MRLEWIPLLLILFVPSYGSGLQFESTRQELKAELGQESVRVTYPFEVVDSGGIEILDIRTSCGCTSAKPEKTDYAVGETGIIEVEFEFGSRMGEQKKTVTVVTSSGSALLHLEVMIPRKWTLEPRILVWNREEALEPHSAILVFHEAITAEIVKVDVPDTGYSVDWSVITPGKAYRFEVTPEKQPPSRYVAVRVVAREAGGELTTIPLYLRRF